MTLRKGCRTSLIATMGALSLAFTLQAKAEGGDGGSVILPHEFEMLQEAAERGAARQAHPAGAPAAQGRHVRPQPGLVDEDEPVRVKARLEAKPALAPTRHVWPRAFIRD